MAMNTEKMQTIRLEVCRCLNKETIIEFLKNIDKRLPIPVSEKVDFEQYAEKIINKGQVLAIMQNNKIVSAGFIYCNDNVSKRGYVSLFGTLYGYENSGYGKRILEEVDKVAKENGMNKMGLHTEKSNERAIRFYNRNGYQIVNMEQKIYMEKNL